MLEQIWNGILEFTSKLVIPDWPGLITLLPVFMGFIVVLFFVRVVIAYAGAGPTRRGGGPITPLPPAGVHMPGPSYAPVFAAVGSFLLFVGLVFGTVFLVLGLLALVLTLLYWGREAIRDFDHISSAQRPLPAVVHEGPPPGVHMPGPSFRPVLASLAVSILFAGLVFGGWIFGFGVLITIVTLLGWLNDARKEYRHVVAADATGHIENEPPPTWPKTVLWIMAIGLVVSVVLTNGWFPPRSSAAPGGGAPGASGAPAGSGGPPASGGAGGDVSVTAENVKFNTTTLMAPADRPFKLAFDNKDAGTPHDVDILDASGKKVFDGKEFPGPKVTVYDVPPLAAGTYKFECSIHPALMNGELTAGG